MAGRRDRPLWLAPRTIRYLASVEPEPVKALKPRLDPVAGRSDAAISWYRDRHTCQVWKCTASEVDSWMTETLEPVAEVET